MAKKGLIALFSGLGVVGLLVLVAIIASIVGAVVWYFDYYKKKHSTASYMPPNLLSRMGHIPVEPGLPDLPTGQLPGKWQDYMGPGLIKPPWEQRLPVEPGLPDFRG